MKRRRGLPALNGHDDAGRGVRCLPGRHESDARHQFETRFQIFGRSTFDVAYDCRIEEEGSELKRVLGEAVLKITGFSTQDLKARGGWRALILAADQAAVTTHLRRVLGGQRDLCVFRVVTRSREIHWLGNLMRPVSDEAERRVVHVYGLAKDLAPCRQDGSTDLGRQAGAGLPPVLPLLQEVAASMLPRAASPHGFLGGIEHAARFVHTVSTATHARHQATHPEQRLSEGAYPGKRRTLMIVKRNIMCSLEEKASRQGMERPASAGVRAQGPQSDLHASLHEILASVVRVMPDAEAASLWRYDEKTGHLAPEVWCGQDDASRHSLYTSLETTICGIAMQSGKPVFMEDLRQAVDAQLLSLPSLGRIRSVLGVPLHVEDQPLGALLVESFAKEDAFGELESRLLMSFAVQAGLAIRNARLVEEVRSMSQRMLQAQEAERRRIAQDLHDEVGGLLTSLRISLKMITPQDEATRQELATAGGLLDILTQQIRGIALNLRPRVLDDLGLVAALRALFERLGDRNKLDVDWYCELPEQGRLDADLETAAYRIIQEALTNVTRHAGVASAQVLLHQEAGCLVLHVIDEGRGFDPEAAPASSMGLSGMKERATLLGGSLEVASAPGEGTRVSATLPLDG